MLKTVKKAQIEGKRVLVRAGFDVPLNEKGQIEDDSRIQEALPTIKYILEQKPESLIIISHLDRPGGKPDPKLSNEKIAHRLSELLGFKQSFNDKLRNPNEEKMTNDQIPQYEIGENVYLLENIRFYPEEEKNDKEFAKKLSSLGDIFVFEAFSAAHREHASTIGIMDYLDSYAGFGVENEIKHIKEILENPTKPFVVIIGGAKVEDKGPVIENLIKIADIILVGGKTANILHQEGTYSKESKVILNSDGVDQNKEIIYAEDRAMDILDIGPKTIHKFCTLVEKAKTILVAGPLGKFEEKPFNKGTQQVYKAIAGSQARKYAFGGDTMEVLRKLKIKDKFDFVSTGGGAALEYLAKGNLPIIKKLEINQQR